MAKIISKLNLNKTPQQVDDYSLVYARNIKILADESIGRDAPITEVDLDITIPESETILTENNYITTIPHTDCVFNLYKNSNNKIIVGIIYNDGRTEVIQTGAIYYNGTIEGLCISNLRNDRLLVLGEYGISGQDIPLRVINLEECSINDDESIYYVSPQIPLTNLDFVSYFNAQIPNGVYQFYIRYKTPYNKYTKWFLCSKELRAYQLKKENTPQGTLLYVNDNRDATLSFGFKVNHINPQALSLYKEFQIAYIVSTGDDVLGRIWNTFPIDTEYLYFALKSIQQEVVEVEDLLEDTFSLFNVKNIAYFKNKVYISNYKENEEPWTIQSDTFGTVTLNDFINGKTVGSSILPRGITIELVYKPITTSDSTVVEWVTAPGTNRTCHIEHGVITGIKGADDDIERRINDIIGSGNDSFVGDLETALYLTLEDYIDGEIPDNVASNYGIDRNITFEELSVNDFPSDITIPTTEENDLYIWYKKQGSNQEPYIRRKQSYGDRLSSIYRADGGNIMARVREEYYECSTSGQFIAHELSLINNGIVDIYLVQNYDGAIKYYHLSIEYIDKNVVNISNSVYSIQTLVPYQTYTIYAHFVDKYGIHTRGYEVGKVTPKDPSEVLGIEAFSDIPYAIYPKFTIRTGSSITSIFDKYKAIFFTIQHTENKSIHVKGSHDSHYGDSIDLDLLNESITDGEYVKYTGLDQNHFKSVSLNAFYRHSSDFTFYDVAPEESADADRYKSFVGTSGKVYTKEKPNIAQVYNGYIIQAWKLLDKGSNIYRCTNLINFTHTSATNTIYDDLSNLTLGGFLCRVSKPTVNEFLYYRNSSITYEKQTQGSSSQPSNPLKVQFIEIQSDDEDAGSVFDIHETTPFWVYSNNDVTGIGLSDKLTYAVKTLSNGVTRMANIFNSMNLADIYKPLKMYNNFTKKAFLLYDENEKIYYQFNNTIRGSKKIGDEELIDVAFESTEYYNVPTDKGKIVNLMSIGDIILVHTEHSAYKFNGSNSLTSSGGTEIQTTESEVFDTGISEMYGSDKGYGGLQDKHHACISQIGYVFWEKDTNRIYINNGQAELKCISTSIRKLLERLTPTSVVIANDFYNDRLIFCFQYNENSTTKYLTISYSFITQEFASIHSFKFEKTFNTKNKTYINQAKALGEIGTGKITINDDEGNTVIPSNFYNDSDFFPTSVIQHRTQQNTIIQIPTAYVDILVNTNYENIKILNSVSWICNTILKYERNDTEIAEERFDKNIAVDQAKLSTLNIYGGDIMKIYSDSTETDSISLTDLANNASIEAAAVGYKKPAYNEGVWSLNYFRNILNVNGITGETTPGYSDNHSLIYGKYFVVRFIFKLTKDFKLENLIVNVNNKY